MSLRDFNTPYSDDPTALHHVPGGNETGLESFHTVQPEDIEPNNTPKIVGAVAVALMVGVAGVALYASQGSSFHSKQMVAAAQPAPVMPPPAVVPASDATTPVSTPADAPEPVKSVEPVALEAAPVKSAAIPTPVSPTLSPSDVATNNTQSDVAVPQGVTIAADIPNPAPAQTANPAPAPAEPSGQTAQ